MSAHINNITSGKSIRRLARNALAGTALAASIGAAATALATNHPSPVSVKSSAATKAPASIRGRHLGAKTTSPKHRGLPVFPLGNALDTDKPGTASIQTPLIYSTNGWVQTSPRLYLVYWGDWSTDSYGVMNRLYYFYKGVGGSGWNQTQTQYGYNCAIGSTYCSSSAKMITNPANQLVNYWKDTSFVPATPTQAQMAAEAQKAANYFGDRSINAQYIIALPTGHRDAVSIAKGWCAWHNYTTSYGNLITYTSMPYIPDMGTTCGMNKVNAGAAGYLDGVTILAGHEYAETETDPFLNAWLDSDRTGNEDADKCLQWNLPGYFRNYAFSTGTFAVQPLWSDRSFYSIGNGCVFWS
jgi:hypothetical protein